MFHKEEQRPKLFGLNGTLIEGSNANCSHQHSNIIAKRRAA
jgi:hypothetical protein